MADDLQLVEVLQKAHRSIVDQLSRVIVGQKEVVEQLLIALFARGHCLLVGVPGLAKTLLISSLSRILDLRFKRIQFTPDLMPSDITGTEVIEEDVSKGKRSFRFISGPVFANLVLADEINRAPPKTQAALLQAMQEYQVTVAGQTHALPLPFFVLATQNPIEQEGTYPLPEAQLDRFLFQINITYPSAEEERSIVLQTTGQSSDGLDKALANPDILHLQEIVRRVPAPERVVHYAVDLVRMTRPSTSLRTGPLETASPELIRKNVQWGAGPRASQALILGGKARAVLQGRLVVSDEDVRALALPVLRHRVILNFHAEAEGLKIDDLLQELLNLVPVPRG